MLILVAIAIPSIRLLRHQYSPPPADLTVKVIGHQWYWTYEYPDNGVTFDSYMLKEADDPTRQANQRARTDADGPPLLAVDERMVIPAGKVVKFIVTADDVIHSFAVPAFWKKQDANPGQLHETWVKVDRPGVYFGQCSELCGARHAYMPIAVEVVPEAQFAAWVASKGGTMPGARPAPPPDSTAARRSPTRPSGRCPAPARRRRDPQRSAARDQPGRDGPELRAEPSTHEHHSRRRASAQGPRGARRASRRRPQAGLLRPLVHVDQPQGHRHALSDLRDRRRDHRRRDLGDHALPS